MAIAQKRLPAKPSDVDEAQRLPSNVQLLAGQVVEVLGQDLYLVAYTHDPAPVSYTHLTLPTTPYV